MATRAKDVMGAEVAEAWITCRKGCSNDGASNARISTFQLVRIVSLLKTSRDLYTLPIPALAGQNQPLMDYPACFYLSCRVSPIGLPKNPRYHLHSVVTLAAGISDYLYH